MSSDLQEIIRKRPKLFAELIRQLERAPNHAVLKVMREVAALRPDVSQNG